MTCEFPFLQAPDSFSIERAGKLIIEDESVVARILEKDGSISSSHNDMGQYVSI